MPVFGARPFGTRGFGDNTGDTGLNSLSGIVWDAEATHVVDGDTTVAIAFVWGAAAAHTLEGETTVSLGFIVDLDAVHSVTGEFVVAIPPIEGALRVVLVDAFGNALGVLENAIVGPVSFRLNAWEDWSFTLPVTDPKAHLILEEHIREAQIWKGDILLSWGPMVRPTVDDNLLTVQGSGAMWHFSRRHIGKANRENYLCNPSFEKGIGCWNWRRDAYYLDYAPITDEYVRSWAPSSAIGSVKDGKLAVVINADIKPWVSPGDATNSKNHVVVTGDTLWALAKTYYGSGIEWYRIYNANQAQIQADAVAAGLWNPHDPGHWIFPGQNLTIPGIATTEVVTAPEDDATRWGQVFGYQTILVSGGTRGRTATLSGWAFVPGSVFEDWGVHRTGVMLQRYKTDYKTNNYWTQNGLPNTHDGARAFYTDFLDSVSSRIDEGHPFNTWVRHETSITVPPNTTEYVHARITCVSGRTFWDKMALTFDDAFEVFDEEQTQIAIYLVEHAQDPAFDKNDINIVVEIEPTGVLRSLVALHSEHANIWDLLVEPTTFRDGFDIGMRYTPTERIMTTHFPQKGTVHRRLHLQPQRNISSFSWSFDGEAASSSVVTLGTGDGSDREEAAAIDTSSFANGLVLETVFAVGPDTPIELLQELADEKLNVVKNPEVLSITTYPHDPSSPERNFIGKLWHGDVVPVTIRKSYVDENQNRELQFEIDDDYRVVELSINPDDSLSLTLNRREMA